MRAQDGGVSQGGGVHGQRCQVQGLTTLRVLASRLLTCLGMSNSLFFTCKQSLLHSRSESQRHEG